MLQETDWGRAEDGPAVRAADTHLRQDGSEKGGHGEKPISTASQLNSASKLSFFLTSHYDS